MLTELSIRDLAILPEVELRFGPGLNVLSGETGAGKSLVIGGLRLLCGERPPPDFVRKGVERGVVEAVFELPADGWMAKRLAASGIEIEDGELILRREVAAEGKGRIRANGQAVPLRVLTEAAEVLVDLHGQHDHQALLRPSWQLESLDEFAGLAADRDRFATELDAWRTVRADLDATASAGRESAERAALRRFQREELDRADMQPGELTDLLAERGRLSRAAQLRETAARVVDGLVEDEGSVREVAARLARSAADAADHDPAWRALAESLEGLAVIADDAARDARRRLDEAIDDPERLAWVRDRVRLLEDLLRKYGPEEEALLRTWQDLRADDTDPHARERRIEALRGRARDISDRLLALGEKLGKRRAAAGKKLAASVAQGLEQLGMPGARFEVSLKPRETGDLLREEDGRLAGPSGFDSAEFLLAANRGGAPLPLRSAASGGELSRVMLALKSVLGATRGTATMVFDEIDHGIGGLVAGRLALALAGLARDRQVLCITHLPQIAACADRHFRVVKQDRDGATVAGVEQVTGEARVREIARMLGESGVKGVAVDHARTLLERGAA